MRKTTAILVIFLIIAITFFSWKPAYAENIPLISVSPDKEISEGTNFILDVKVENVSDMISWSVTLKFRKILFVSNVTTNTSFFDNEFFSYNFANLTYNYYKLEILSTTLGVGVNGNGTLAHINCTSVYNGSASLQVLSTEILNSSYENVTHTRAACTVTVIGTPSKTFLDIDSVSNGILNITEGTHIYDNTSILQVYATQTIAVFQYFILDGIQNTTNPISIQMSVDHELSATFKIPALTITTQPSATIKINNIPYQSNGLGILNCSLSLGTHQLEISKPWYYKYKATLNVSGDESLIIPLNEMDFSQDIPHTSEMTTMQATIAYNNVSKSAYYLDFNKLLYAEPIFNKTGKVSITFHYNTNYPIVEIESENIAKICFDLTEVYSEYYISSYSSMIQASQFTGIKIDSNVPLTLEIGMPQPSELWKRPAKIYKMTPGSGIEEFASWHYSDFTLYLNFQPGDPTLSLIFPEPNNALLTMFNLLPFIFIATSVVFLFVAILEVRHKDMKEFFGLIILAIFIASLIPIVPIIWSGV